MLTPYRRRWRFKLTTARGRSLRDPGPDRVREALVRLSNDAYYAVLTRADEWYVQVGYGERAGTRPGWHALERQDGRLDQHFRVELMDIEEVVPVFRRLSSGGSHDRVPIRMGPVPR